MKKINIILFLPLLFSVSCSTDDDSSSIDVSETWNEPTYVWKDDYSEVVATRISSFNHEETETVATTCLTTNPTCTESGSKVYTTNAFTNPNFEVQTKSITLNALGHDWDCDYEWEYDALEDEYYMNASAICSRDSSHVINERVKATYNVVTEPTCHSLGLGRYTANFTNDIFETQTKDVDIAMVDHNYVGSEPVYKISNDFKTCTASLPCIYDGCDEKQIIEEADVYFLETYAESSTEHDGYVLYLVVFDDPSLEDGEIREAIVTGGGEHEWTFVKNVWATFDPLDPYKTIPGYREYSCSCGATKKEYHLQHQPI